MDVMRELAALRTRLRLLTLAWLGSAVILVMAMGGADATAKAVVMADAWRVQSKNAGGTLTPRLTITGDENDAKIKVLNANIELFPQATGSLPAGAVAGTIAYDSTVNKFKFHNGTSWVEAGASLVRINGSSGAAGPDFTWQKLSANSSDVTTTTLSAAVMTTTGLSAGIYRFSYTVIYQSAATNTGIAFGVNYTGTSNQFQARMTHVTTGGAAANGVGDSDTTTATGQLVEGKHDNTKNAIIGSASAGVDSANADILCVIEGILEVTGAGDLELKIASEVSGTAVRLMAGSLLELHKIN